MDQKLIAVEFDEVLDHLLHIDVVPDDFLDFGYAKAFVESHDEDSCCRSFPINARNDDELAIAEKIAKFLNVLRLVLEIHFLRNDSRKLFDDCAGGPDGVVIDELLDDEQ